MSELNISQIDVSEHPEFKGHEAVFRIESGAVIAFVGVHSRALGVAEGGIRYKAYASEDEAITDVLRLSEGMTLKNAGAGLTAGGGKSVVMALDGQPKPSEEVLRILADALNQINADELFYYGAQDMNVSEENLNFMAQYTDFIKGASAPNPSIVGGDPSPLTALGVFEAMKLAVAEVYGGEKSLSDLTVAMQGIGGVGGALARHLLDAGACIVACDPSDAAFDGLEIARVGLDEIYDARADIFAPNAIGGTLNDDTVPRLYKAGVKIICGAANNQQAQQIGHVQSKMLLQKGILYCPDFIVNAGGIIWVNQVGENAAEVTERVRTHMPKSLKKIIDLQKEAGGDMGALAESYALSLVLG